MTRKERNRNNIL